MDRKVINVVWKLASHMCFKSRTYLPRRCYIPHFEFDNRGLPIFLYPKDIWRYEALLSCSNLFFKLQWTVDIVSQEMCPEPWNTEIEFCNDTTGQI